MISITCLGINNYWIDDKGPVSADQYGNRPFSYTLKLNSGIHSITSLIRGKPQAQIKCSINVISSKKFDCIVSVDRNRIPDIMDNQLASDIIGITVENVSPVDAITVAKISEARNGNELYRVKKEQPKWPQILPNQILRLPLQR